MKKIINSNSGFSLVEIMVSVGILAVLTLIGNAAYKGYRANALKTVAVSNARNIANAYQVCTASGGNCNTFEGIQMGHIQGITTDEIGSDAICFSLQQASGSQIVKSCVSINLTSGKETYSLGWFPGSNPLQNNNPEKLCYCTDTAGANPILTGSDTTCNADGDCTCPTTGTNTEEKCQAQRGQCDGSTGLCL